MQEFDDYQVLRPREIVVNISRYTKPTSKATNERASLIEPFVKRLQRDAIRAGFRPMSEARIGMLMAYIATSDLDYFYKKLDQSPNFGAIWNWYVNPKKK